MAKKTVATLHEGSKDGRAYTKVIKMVKSPKTGAYIFDEQMVPNEAVKDFLFIFYRIERGCNAMVCSLSLCVIVSVNTQMLTLTVCYRVMFMPPINVARGMG